MALYHSCSEKPEIGSHYLFDSFVFFTPHYQTGRGKKVFKIEDEDAFDIISIGSAEREP